MTDRKRHLNTRVVLPALTGVIGILWIYVGLVHHGWWVEGRPGSGFFPSLAGGILLFVSILAVLSERREEPPMFMVSHVYPVAAAVAVVLLALLIGFFPALTLYVLGWVKFYERYRWPFSLAVTAVTIGAMYGIFSIWLRVPFPDGALFAMVVS